MTAPPTTVNCKLDVTGAVSIASSALFGVIYCDPPWRRENSVASRATENHYPTMSVEEICAIEVPAAKNCVLWMWATSPNLADAIAVIAAWGFTYKTHAVWDKEIIGCGWWFRNQHELLMVATRGKMSPPAQPDRISSVIRARRSTHSSKPDRVRDLIAKWYPGERKLEMFARPYTEMWPKHEGWETWGNELPNDVAMTPNIVNKLQLCRFIRKSPLSFPTVAFVGFNKFISD